MGSLPHRTIHVATDDPESLVRAQPERRRRFDQIGRGRFEARLHEAAWGAAALQAERWSCGLRVRCDRPVGHLTFAVVQSAGDVRWCGLALAPGDLLRIDRPWELSSSGPVSLSAFAVDEVRLQEVASQLAGGEWRPQVGNRRGRGTEASDGLVQRIRQMLATLGPEPPGAPALAAAEADLLHLAASLERDPDREPIERSTPQTRRRVVRRVEEYLDAKREDVPSIAALCALAGVSERTLEYAFREHLGTTPLRFLKLRRLNRVRRELLDPEPGASVANAAHGAGVHGLGRFAGEYRSLFGELPSETLRRSQGRG